MGKSKLIIFVVTALIAVLSFTVCVYAESEDEIRQVRFDERGNWVSVGGSNEFAGKTAKTREEAEALERTLILNDYILLNTDNAQIPEEDFNTFINHKLYWFTERSRKIEPYWGKYKLYLPYDVYHDFMDQLEADGDVQIYTDMEVETSAVVVNYLFYDTVEKAGTRSYEFNGGIPSYITSTGWIRIISPIDVEIVFLNAANQQYFVFYVPKNKEFMVEFPETTDLRVVSINGKNVSENDSHIAKGNRFYLNTSNTLEAPAEFDTTEVVEAYKIPEIDISGKPDYSFDFSNPDKIPEEERTVVKDLSFAPEEETTEKSNGNLIPLIIILGIIGAIGLIILIKTRNSREGE